MGITTAARAMATVASNPTDRAGAPSGRFAITSSRQGILCARASCLHSHEVMSSLVIDSVDLGHLT